MQTSIIQARALGKRTATNGPLSETDREHFAVFLAERLGYADTTIREVLKDAQRLEREGRLPITNRARLRIYQRAWDLLRAAGFEPRSERPDESWIQESEHAVRGLGGRRYGRRDVVEQDQRKVKRSEPLRPEEYRRLVAALERDALTRPRPRERAVAAVALVLARTGLRAHDVLSIPAGELHLARKRTPPRVRLEAKGGRRVDYPLAGAEDAWEHLAALTAGPSKRGLLIAHSVARNAEHLDEATAVQRARDAVYHYLERVSRKLGIDPPARPHLLRATVASLAFELTEGNLAAVQRMLLHTSPKTTERYVRTIAPQLVVDVQRKLREALRP